MVGHSVIIVGTLKIGERRYLLRTNLTENDPALL